MIKDKLFDAAFRYKSTGLWKKLWDSDVFALTLPDGETGYISIMGKSGEYNALALYLGDDGYLSYNSVQENSGPFTSEFEQLEKLLVQDCVQMELCGKDELEPDELEEARAYAKKNGIRFAGANAYPHFLRFRPNYHPWKVTEQKDAELLTFALHASAALADMLKKEAPAKLHITALNGASKEVPLFSFSDEKLKFEKMIPLPQKKQKKTAPLKFTDEIALQKIKKLKKTGVWECELVRFTKPVGLPPEEIPYYPLYLFVVNRGNHMIMPTDLFKDDDGTLKGGLASLPKAIIERRQCPKEIYVREERTIALLSDFCKKAGIQLHITDPYEPLDALDEAMDSFMTEFGPHSNDFDDDTESMDELLTIIDMILNLPKSEISKIPPEVLNGLKAMIAAGALPPDITEQLRKKLGI